MQPLCRASAWGLPKKWPPMSRMMSARSWMPWLRPWWSCSDRWGICLAKWRPQKKLRGRWRCPISAFSPLTPPEGESGPRGHLTLTRTWLKRCIKVWPRGSGSCQPTLGPRLRRTACLRRKNSLCPDRENSWSQGCTRPEQPRCWTRWPGPTK